MRSGLPFQHHNSSLFNDAIPSGWLLCNPSTTIEIRESNMKDIFSPVLVLLSSARTPTIRRDFLFVPYGDSFSDNPDHRPTISCDGRIPGSVTLELTHWVGNETPDSLYADTSTEMALKLAEHKEISSSLEDALVLNNHYDTDGVLSCWACLNPEQALKYKALLRESAEAGDFGEWPSDDGVKLNFIVENLCSTGDEEGAYEIALEELPKILIDLTENKGKDYEDLWRQDFDKAMESLAESREGKVSLVRGPGNIVLVKESASGPMDCHALHKALLESKTLAGTSRILRLSQGGLYRYHKIGHGWVKRLVDRPVVPEAEPHKIVSKMNAICESDTWVTGGSGLTAICQSKKQVTQSPEEVLQQLRAFDEGSH
eukprot:scaffold36436_cov176-Amphora_coffeaeformis.AAC.5